ncbi:phosphodiester glycosidase family protein [Clostridium sp.]|uniref:phosphodiester glycosidase family protein n=1 Tax=Clostridium sp. TaxID=1506 RepID=UPI002A919CD6|nr:phosphodiester glycosidase family protein [Clostridium sp.]MDY6013313.1 phosphodiester glycosidase family protein [Clostridium sp.]
MGSKRKRNKKKWKRFIAFIMFELIFTIITAPFILLYGPFDNAKRIYVGSAMTTFNHQYLATMFLSKERIDNILNSSDTRNQNLDFKSNNSVVEVSGTHDNTMELYKFDNSKYNGYMLVIKDPKRVKVAYTSSMYKKGQTTSEMAMQNNAVAAINGGAFIDTSSNSNWTGNGGTPTGVIISNGKIVFSDLKTDNSKTECMAITKEGKMLAGKYSINELKALDVQEAVSFKPVLIKDGVPTALEGSDGARGIAPRTAIGQRADGSIVMMVIDGRDLVSGLGCTITELQSLMLTKGECVTAINLDGGKSSTMYLNGQVINNVSNGLGERYIASSIIVK